MLILKESLTSLEDDIKCKQQYGGSQFQNPEVFPSHKTMFSPLGIVGRVDGHVIYDPSAWLVSGFPKECI